jgi:hypothetical protein
MKDKIKINKPPTDPYQNKPLCNQNFLKLFFISIIVTIIGQIKTEKATTTNNLKNLDEEKLFKI